MRAARSIQCNDETREDDATAINIVVTCDREKKTIRKPMFKEVGIGIVSWSVALVGASVPVGMRECFARKLGSAAEEAPHQVCQDQLGGLLAGGAR